MNATPLAAFPFRHPARVRAALIALALALVCGSGCAHILGGSSHSGPPRCADLVAHAFASPNVTVPGAYACFGPGIQTAAANLTPPVIDDASLAAYAATDPVFTAYASKGSKFDATAKKLYHYFEFTPGPMCWRVHLDAAGLIADGEWKHGSCLPLP
jgi:hypothetical protein